MPSRFAIVDLFAGPGGLAEGFSSIRDRDGDHPFEVVLSVEKEQSAYQTLLLRNFLRQFETSLPDEYYSYLNGDVDEPDWAILYPKQWLTALSETLNLELGSEAVASVLDDHIGRIRKKFGGNIILIGGPPCQAYSLVGRARNKGISGYKASEDHRHFLYREYIRILDKLKPAIFVMENVKGMLSSSVDGERIFERVLDDLTEVDGSAYELVPLSPGPSSASLPLGKAHRPPSDFIVCSELLGLPQARHRVIVVGIRKAFPLSLNKKAFEDGLLASSTARVGVKDILRGMPRLRSGLSGDDDDAERWTEIVAREASAIAGMTIVLPPAQLKKFRRYARKTFKKLQRKVLGRTSKARPRFPASCPAELKRWLADCRLERLPNYETRSHMSSDLGRYFFTSLFARITGRSPKAFEFPAALAPDHRNWKTGKFADRFRAQVWNEPASTVTSHISKDGHYYIHPDPLQCRSLTVREAARLQTFPDNYLFKGNRTQQYVQVGNAVPPFLARKIAEALYRELEDVASPVKQNRLARN